MGAYRELVYGLCFLASAVAGGFLGLVLLSPSVVTSPPQDDDLVRQEFGLMMIGVICACGGWLWFKYRWLDNRR
ncbi:MAG TPA: hypothetical protein VGI40_05360 [Pirellulaceae bacterium]